MTITQSRHSHFEPIPLRLNPRILATIYLVGMSIQIIPIEGEVVSWLKMLLMALSPLFLLYFASYRTSAFKWGFLYIGTLVISVCINREDFRLGSFLYRILGIISFILYYNLIYGKKCFSKKYFIIIIRDLIIAYGVVLIIQQLFNLLFLHGNRFMLLNLISTAKRSVLCANSLALEPSHSARILGALFLSFFRMIQLSDKTPYATIKIIWSYHRRVLLLFLWSMLSMDSGTAMIVLAILFLLLLKDNQLIIGGVIGIALLFSVASMIDFTPLNRAIAASTALNTGDIKEVQSADLSASARIVPFLYTYQNFDLSDFSQWFGQGIDTARNRDESGVFQFIGQIDDYGFVSYVFSLIFFFKCCIRRFISVETIFFVVTMMMEVGNVYYVWCICMLFATVKYFGNLKDKVQKNSFNINFKNNGNERN